MNPVRWASGHYELLTMKGSIVFQSDDHVEAFLCTPYRGMMPSVADLQSYVSSLNELGP